jgi:sugar phosphate isomerase/epimerase
MRISASICPAARVPFSFSGSIKHTLPTLRRMRYDGVELLLRRADDIDFQDLERLLSKYELEVSAIGTGLATADGLTLSYPAEATRSKAVRRVVEVNRLAQRFECPVILGSILASSSMGHSLKSLKRSLRELRDVYAVIEPLNRYESAVLNKASDALSLIEELDLDRFGILLDTFHMNIEEKKLPNTIKRVGRKLKHFHVADSNRMTPGEGHIRFDEVFSALKAIEYRGFLSVEVLQRPSSKAALIKAIRFLRGFSAT